MKKTLQLFVMALGITVVSLSEARSIRATDLSSQMWSELAKAGSGPWIQLG